MSITGHLDQSGVGESSDDLLVSNRIFFFTDDLQSSRSQLEALRLPAPCRLVFVDNEKWSRRLAMRKPDAFISHDWRDKDSLARPLTQALERLGLVVWFDEFSLRPGDQLSASIDKGLTECRHGIVLVTPHFLENKGWGSTELSTLLTRAVDEPNVLIPVWSSVDKDVVKARSARLADAVAIKHSGDVGAFSYPSLRGRGRSRRDSANRVARSWRA